MIGIEHEAVGGSPFARSWKKFLEVEVADEYLAIRKHANANTNVSSIAHFSEIVDLASVIFDGESQLDSLH